MLQIFETNELLKVYFIYNKGVLLFYFLKIHLLCSQITIIVENDSFKLEETHSPTDEEKNIFLKMCRSVF